MTLELGACMILAEWIVLICFAKSSFSRIMHNLKVLGVG